MRIYWLTPAKLKGRINNANKSHPDGSKPLGRWRALLVDASLLLAGAAHSAAPDLAKAEELLQSGEAAEALILFEQALEADPSSVGAHLGLGRAYYALGQYARARNESYDDERPDFSTDPELLKVRNDDVWNSGGGLVWGFGSGWSVRPTFEYNWEDSNIDAIAYSSTELWLTVRKSF